LSEVFMERLYSGTFQCPGCQIQYEAKDDPESELICEECGEALVPMEE